MPSSRGLLLPAGSLPPPLSTSAHTPLEITSSYDFPTNIDSGGTAPSTQFSHEWKIFCWLVTCSLRITLPTASERYTGPSGDLSPEQGLQIICGFLSFSPPLQREAHIGLLASLVKDGSNNRCAVVLSMRNPKPLPEDVNWERVLELAHFIHCGLQAAITRTGSAGNTVASTPGWLRRQCRIVTESSFRVNFNVGNHSDTTLGIPDETASSLTHNDVGRLRPRRATQLPPALAVQSTSSSLSDGPSMGTRIPRDARAASKTRTRDARCLITGYSDYSGLVTAHIIPHSCGCYTEGFSVSYFWLFVQLWLGYRTAESIWAYVGAEKINRLENLITLTALIHSQFGDGSLIIEPATETFKSVMYRGGVHQRSINKNAVVVQILEMRRGVLRHTLTTRVVFALATTAVDAGKQDVLELDLDDSEDVDATRVKSGNFMALSRGKAASMKLALPDPALLAVFAGMMRMRLMCCGRGPNPSTLTTTMPQLQTLSIDNKAIQHANIAPSGKTGSPNSTGKPPSATLSHKNETSYYYSSPRPDQSHQRQPHPDPNLSPVDSKFNSQEHHPHIRPAALTFQQRHASALYHELFLLQQAQLNDEGVLLGFERLMREQEAQEEKQEYLRLWQLSQHRGAENNTIDPYHHGQGRAGNGPCGQGQEWRNNGREADSCLWLDGEDGDWRDEVDVDGPTLLFPCHLPTWITQVIAGQHGDAS